MSGDPMRFNTAANLAEYMQVEVRLNASRVTAGTFNTARIPNLSASKITSGTFQTARIPTIPTNSLANDAVTQPKMADNAVGPDEMDPESATAGQVMMIGSGGDPAWQFPFEFPTTVSGRAIDTSLMFEHYAVTTSTINVGNVAVLPDISASATFTVSDVIGTGCTIRFWNGTGQTYGTTDITSNGEMTVTADVTATHRGSASPVTITALTSIGSNDCTIDAGAMLTLTIP